MNLTVILAIVIALIGYPIGLLIAKFTEDELRAGKKWFKAIVAVCVLVMIISVIFARGETLLFLIASFAFILLLSLASLVKTRKRKNKC